MKAETLNLCVTREEGKALINYWWDQIDTMVRFSGGFREIPERLGRVRACLDAIERIYNQMQDTKEGEE